MSKWKGKFVIGLTGNIATGKSVVRKMLEHLGVYGIDADALSHRVISKGAPGYSQVIDSFGNWLLDENGDIDRDKLGKLVFSDAEALKKLEAIVHPLVGQAVDHLVKKSPREVVVIEAIKLLDGSLLSACDTIWVATSPEKEQLSRLAEKRGMDEASARERMNTQSSQEEKVAAANTVIQNDGSFEETWKQVKEEWKKLFPDQAEDISGPIQVSKTTTTSAEDLTILRASPKQAKEIAAFITRVSEGKHSISDFDVMAAFGEKAYMLLMSKDKLVGLAGWKVENLVARIDEVYFEVDLNLAEVVPFLFTEVEKASRELQCEASLIFASPDFAKRVEVWSELGYETRPIQELRVSAWQEAAREMQSDQTVMLFKQLRVDRVLKPL
ncbi:MAG: dephospho-CoA kinase [Chloroflexi bacterium]|nr:dephospho-CoA kinase [Chloroflexota bacterium]